MRGLTGRPNLTGKVPFTINENSIERVIQFYRLKDQTTWSALSRTTNKKVDKSAAMRAQQDFVNFIVNGVKTMDANYKVSDQGKRDIAAYFLKKYPKMNTAINPPALQTSGPDMLTQYIRGTQEYRKIRAEIALKLKIKDKGHNVGHGSNSTSRDTRGDIINNLFQKLHHSDKVRVISESKRIYGHTPN